MRISLSIFYFSTLTPATVARPLKMLFFFGIMSGVKKKYHHLPDDKFAVTNKKPLKPKSAQNQFRFQRFRTDTNLIPLNVSI